MKYEIFPPDANLKNIIKHYVVVYDVNSLNNMLFLPNGGSFLVFNRGVRGYSILHNNEKYQIPEGYSVSIKTIKSKKSVLGLVNIPAIKPAALILVELLAIGFYKLFRKDASCLNNKYLPIENILIDKYFSKLYMHESLKQDISYLNESLLNMYNDHSNSKECIEDILEKIVEYNYAKRIEKTGYGRLFNRCL